MVRTGRAARPAETAGAVFFPRGTSALGPRFPVCAHPTGLFLLKGLKSRLGLRPAKVSGYRKGLPGMSVPRRTPGMGDFQPAPPWECRGAWTRSRNGRCELR